MNTSRIHLILWFALLTAGCQSLGPGSLPRDRLGYAGAIAESWN